MNHLKARLRHASARYDYTAKSDGRTWAIGYCAGWREYPPWQRVQFGVDDARWEILQGLKDKFHDDGHATVEEACDCFKQYSLDTRLRFYQADSKGACQVCGESTESMARVGEANDFLLCERHANKDEVAKLYSVVEIWET